MSVNYIKEACVETLEQAVKAEAKGADRLELCAYLTFGGLTPSTDLIKAVMAAVGIPVRVMIRPRNGDFFYNEDELDHMKTCINLCKALRVEGVVFGVLNPDSTLNINAIKKLTEIAQPLKVIIHKAIDETVNPIESLKELLDIEGIDTVLTSGGKSNAFDGAETLKTMVELAEAKLTVMPAGKISQFNLTELDQLIGAKAYHGKLIVGELT